MLLPSFAIRRRTSGPPLWESHLRKVASASSASGGGPGSAGWSSARGAIRSISVPGSEVLALDILIERSRGRNQSLRRDSAVKPEGFILPERLVHSTLQRIARSPASLGELARSVGSFPDEMRPQEKAALLEPMLHRMVDIGYARSIPALIGENAGGRYSITRKGLRQLETIVHSRLPGGPVFPRATPLGGSPPGEELSPLELSQRGIRGARALVSSTRAGETAAKRERALRAYALATRSELDWTILLQRGTGAPAAKPRSRIS